MDKEKIKNPLTEEQRKVLEGKETEKPFSGRYYYHDEAGVYRCAACGNPLFSSEAKFESGSGWPSFYKPVGSDSVREISDDSLGMKRTEIVCGKCGGHLGHVFPDGPKPTGQRFCINSLSLDFENKKREEN